MEAGIQTYNRFFYDDVMQVLSMAPPFFSSFFLVVGLVNHSSIRALHSCEVRTHANIRSRPLNLIKNATSSAR